MGTYGQFCPVAKAMELLDERWTLLIVRELLAGSQHFNELRRGVPKMSPALLSKRLRILVRAGVVERQDDRNRASYVLTPAGKELGPIVEALGRWGARWVPELGDEDLDPHLLLWDMHRNVDHHAVPAGRTTVEFAFRDVSGAARTWWMVIHEGDVDICDIDPGHPVTVTVDANLRTLVQVWRGDLSWSGAMQSGEIVLLGPGHVQRGFTRWFTLSDFAPVPRGVLAGQTGTAGSGRALGGA